MQSRKLSLGQFPHRCMRQLTPHFQGRRQLVLAQPLRQKRPQPLQRQTFRPLPHHHERLRRLPAIRIRPPRSPPPPRTSGCSWIASSIDARIHVEPAAEMIISFFRSTSTNRPSRSIRPTSPVKNHPSTNVAARSPPAGANTPASHSAPECAPPPLPPPPTPARGSSSDTTCISNPRQRHPDLARHRVALRQQIRPRRRRLRHPPTTPQPQPRQRKEPLPEPHAATPPRRYSPPPATLDKVPPFPHPAAFTIAIHIVGTPAICVTRPFSTESSTASS